MANVTDYEDASKVIDTAKCYYCKGNSAVVREYHEGNPVYKTSQEWCAEVGTCAATIDWEKVHNK